MESVSSYLLLSMLVNVFIILGILFFLGGGSVGKGLGVAFRGCGCLIAIIALTLLVLAD